MGQCCLAVLLGQFWAVATEMPHLLAIVALDSSGGIPTQLSLMAYERLVILAAATSSSSVSIHHGAGHVGQI